MTINFLLQVTKRLNSNYLTKVFNVKIKWLLVWLLGVGVDGTGKVGDRLGSWGTGMRERLVSI